jgi:hypothetical protein
MLGVWASPLRAPQVPEVDGEPIQPKLTGWP